MTTKAGGKGVLRRRSLKRTLVEPFKQIKLGLYVIAISLAFVSVGSYLFWLAFNEQYQQVMSIFQVVDPNLRWELITNDVFTANALRLGTLFVTFIVLLFSIVFRMTHRIYGPLVSIERFVDQVARGNYASRVTIRSGDELQRLVGKLNRMAELLERRHGKHVLDQVALQQVIVTDEDEDLSEVDSQVV